MVIESRIMIAWGRENVGLLKRGMRESFGVMVMFYILIGMLVNTGYTFVKTH